MNVSGYISCSTFKFEELRRQEKVEIQPKFLALPEIQVQSQENWCHGPNYLSHGFCHFQHLLLDFLFTTKSKLESCVVVFISLASYHIIKILIRKSCCCSAISLRGLKTQFSSYSDIVTIFFHYSFHYYKIQTAYNHLYMLRKLKSK